MNNNFLQVRDFLQLFPKSFNSVKNFKKGNTSIISGEAELFPEGPRVEYFHDVSSCTVAFYYQGIFLHQQSACVKEDVLIALYRAKEQFFCAELLANYIPDEIDFKKTEKGKRFLKYSFSKKVIKTNHRGQKERWKERRAIKTCGTRWEQIRDYKSIVLNSAKSKKTFLLTSSGSYIPGDEYILEMDCNTFLTKGMNALIHKDGTTGAVTFNPNYLGIRIIRA